MGSPHLPGTDTVNKVVYAHGDEAIPTTASMEERIARYDKVRDAVGGDDFAELLPAKSFVRLAADGQLEIELTADKMSIFIVASQARAQAPVPTKH